MLSEQIRFWLETLGSIAGISALVFVGLELLRARRADARDFLFHIYEKYEGLADELILVEAVDPVNLEELMALVEDEEFSAAFQKMFNFWELLTKTVRDNAIDKAIAFEHFGAPFIRFYGIYSNAQHEWNRIGNGINFFKSFDWFYAEIMKAYPGELEAAGLRNEFVAGLEAKALE